MHIPISLAPRIFPVAYNVVKRFMDENTKRKIVVLGGKSFFEVLEIGKFLLAVVNHLHV